MERTLESNVFPEMFEEQDIRSFHDRGTFQEGKRKGGFFEGDWNTEH